MGTEFVPTAIARLVRLRPRPRLPEGAIAVDSSTLDALTDADDGIRCGAIDTLTAAAPASWASFARQVARQEWRFWVADLAWAGPSEAGGQRRLVVLDTEAGLLTLGGDESAMTLAPTTPTDIWRLLSSILPTDEELSPR